MNSASASAAPAPVAVLPVDANSNVAMSYSGRYAAFNTSAALAADDKNGVSDIYIKDFESGLLVRVSLATNGAEANGASSQPALSADGRHLIFTSLASNLVANDNNGVSDVFHKDLQTGVVKMVSSAGTEAPGNGASRSGDISADGRYATFVSAATNLARLDSNTGSQVYRKDLEFGVIKLVSATATGFTGDGASFSPDISGDGNVIAFSSLSTNLGDTPTDGSTPFPYLKGMVSDLIYDGWAVSTRAPVLLPIQAPMISNDAQRVAVTISGIVYFLDFGQKAASNISSGTHGEYVSYATNRALSSDGGRILYSAAGDDTIGGDDNPWIQLYLRDTANGTLMRLSTSADGYAANANIGYASLSGDGKVAMFVSTASNLGGANPGQPQLFRVQVPTMEAVSTNKYLSDSVSGATSLAAGAGHDTYFVSKTETVVVEQANGGHDRVVSNVEGYVLPANVENLVLGTALSGSGNDLANQLRGNPGNNVLKGGGGNDWISGLDGSDIIDGGAGLDTAVYNAFSTDVIVSKDGAGFKVSSKFVAGEADLLSGVERIKLNDVMVGLDIDGVGGKAYRIYKAAFDRTPDAGGLGFWIAAMDKGATLQSVAAGFVKSAEFASLYGANPDNLSLVTRMYTNVLDRAPDQAGLDFWVDLLDRKVITGFEALAEFSESPENYAAVIGQIQHGFFFAAMP